MRTIRSGSWETIGLICCRGERREVNLIIVLMIVLLVLSLMESILHCIALKKIPFRILVNGTRGKTTTTRLIAAALRDKGIRTYAKTTGSDAQIIKDDGSVVMLKRRRGVRLTENISFVHKAAKAGCRCIVVECMALHEESQRMMASKFIRPTHTIIINTLSDHMDAMGEKREDVAWTLSQSVDKDTKLYVTEDFYDSLNVRSFNKVKVRHYDFESSVSVADEDVSLAVSLLKDFSLTEEEVLEEVPGRCPYKSIGSFLKPHANASCIRCGKCYLSCPSGAIDEMRPNLTDDAKCIGCARCIAICPEKAREYDAAEFEIVEERIKRLAEERKEPELFL